MTSSSAPSADDKVGLRSILTDPLVGPLIVVVLIVLTGIGFVFPIVPLFARSFGVGNDGAGLMIAVFGFARLLGDLLGGSIVDRRGERWTAVAGMTLSAVASSATASAPNFAFAAVAWGVAGIGSAVVFAALFSYVLKAARKDRVARTLSFFFGAFNIGIIAGGAAGGFLADRFGLSAPLYAYSVTLLVGIAAYVAFVPLLPVASKQLAESIPDVEPIAEAAGAETPRPSTIAMRDLLRLPGFATTLLLNLIYLWMVAAIFNTLIPLFATDELHMSPAGIGAMFAVGIAAEFVVLFPAGSLADRYGRRAVMIPSLAGLAVMIVVLGTAVSPLWLTLFLAMLAVTSGFAGVPPAAMLSDIVPSEHSGRGTGAFRFAGDLGFFFGPLLAGVISKGYGFQAAFAATAVIPALGVVLVLRMRETMRRAET